MQMNQKVAAIVRYVHEIDVDMQPQPLYSTLQFAVMTHWLGTSLPTKINSVRFRVAAHNLYF